MDPIFCIEKCVRCRTATMPDTGTTNRIYDCPKCHLVWTRTTDA